jgi:hypothetical protein
VKINPSVIPQIKAAQDSIMIANPSVLTPFRT